MNQDSRESSDSHSEFRSAPGSMKLFYLFTMCLVVPDNEYDLQLWMAWERLLTKQEQGWGGGGGRRERENNMEQFEKEANRNGEGKSTSTLILINSTTKFGLSAHILYHEKRIISKELLDTFAKGWCVKVWMKKKRFWISLWSATAASPCYQSH